MTRGDKLDADALRRRAGDICSQVLAEDRHPTHDELMSVAWLTLAAGAVKPPAPPPPRSRVAIPVLLFTLSAVAIGVLAFEHPQSTEVALAASASSIGLQLEGQHVVLDRLDVVEIGVVGCDAMWVPERDGVGTRQVRDEALKLRVPANGAQPGTLTVSRVVAPAGARVRIERDRSASRLAGARPGQATGLGIAVLAKTLDVQVVATGNLEMALIAERMAPLALAGTRVIDLQCEASDWIRLTVTAPEPGIELHGPLRLSDLSFEDIDEYVDADRTVVSRQSTLEAGALTMRSLNGETRTLERGALLRFSRVNGETRRLAAADSALTLEFAGDVEGMETGSQNNPVDLMPSRLQWLRARKTLEVTSGAALYLFGMALAVYRWMQHA